MTLLPRLTLCNFAVDETTAEQRASHRLREAAICGRCAKAAQAYRYVGARRFEVAFTERGKRRHYALLVQE